MSENVAALIGRLEAARAEARQLRDEAEKPLEKVSQSFYVTRALLEEFREVVPKHVSLSAVVEGLIFEFVSKEKSNKGP